MKRFLLLLIVILLVVGCNRDTAKEFVKEITCYSDYSTVNWYELNEKYYLPNGGDWDSVTNERIIPDFPIGIVAEF